MIRNSMLLLIFAATASLALAEDNGRVQVEFAESQRYLDAGDHARDHERNLGLIEEFLVTEIGACLAEDERAQAQVLDVDLGGYYEWWHQPGGIRIMRDIDFPRIKLGYSVSDAAGNVTIQGQEWLTDPSYLRRGGQRSLTRPLGHEQRMIRTWARDTFCREQ